MSALRTILATLAVVVAANAIGHLASGCALFQTADQINNPTDDGDLWKCRVSEQANFGLNKDAGGAWQMYDDCVRDAGLRGVK